MRDVLHFYIPDFPISVAHVADATLRDRPLAVAPQGSGRTLVQAVSREARADGVTPGMPVERAQRFCPQLVVLLPEPHLLARATTALLDICTHYSPLLEPERPGRFFLDLTGSSRLLGPGRDAAARLEKEIAARLRLPGLVGVAQNKLVARIAAGCVDRPGVCDVLRGSEESFIAPLSVAALPGIGEARSAELLAELNLRTIGELAGLAVPSLRLVFGASAGLVRQRARGIDPTPVRPPQRQPEVTEEAFLERAENDDAVLAGTLCRLTERCGFRLREKAQGARQLVVTVYYLDGVSARRSRRLAECISEDAPLFEAARELLRRACTRRVRVRGLRLACLGLGAARSGQLDLFRASRHHDAALQQALDHLRGRHGMDVIQRAASLLGVLMTLGPWLSGG